MNTTSLGPWRPVLSPARECDPPVSEEDRIAAVYAGRRQSVPPNRYSYFNPANLWITQVREREVLRLLRQAGFRDLASRRILDVGCGTGHWLRQLVLWGARPEFLTGVDLLPDRIAEARQLCPQAVQLRCGSAAAIGFPDQNFDLVLQSTVFTSVLDGGMKQAIAQEMLRVVKPEGMILWYDFRVNNPRNPDVRGVGKSQIQTLFPGCRIRLQRVTLAPPLARRLAPYSTLACELLQKLPCLCTHYLGLIWKS